MKQRIDIPAALTAHALLLGSTLLLTACGGGGGGSTTPTTPTTPTTGASPVFTSANTISVAENTTMTGYTATATDADGDTVSFSLSGGTDQAAFTIDSASGVLSFTTAPDFELPGDSDGDNSYVVEITASDGTNSVAQSVTVTVTDAVEAPTTAAIPSMSFAQTKIFRFTWTDVTDATFYQLQENPDGVTGFSNVGAEIAQGTGTVDLVVPLHARVNAQYMLQSCNAAGCIDSAAVAVSGTLMAAIGYFKASNSEANDQFGEAVSLSGDGSTLAVAARFEDSVATGIIGADQSDNSADASGAVYVFVRNGDVWTQQAYLKASNSEAGDEFGRALSLSSDGNTLAVAAPTEDSDAMGVNGDETNNLVGGSGAVYVFVRDSANVWTQQAYLKASNPGINDFFGIAVSLSGDGATLAVAASSEDSNATGIIGADQGNDDATDSGAVYVFVRSGTDWMQQAYVKASNSGEFDGFGQAVSLSGDGTTLVVGASGEDSNGTETDDSVDNSGAVYVFIRSGVEWTQQAYLKASNSEATDFFGIALSLSSDGTTLAVGANGEDSDADGINQDQAGITAGQSGAVYVFIRSGAVWSQQAYVKASNSEAVDFFGNAVSLSGDGGTLAVGANEEDSDTDGINGAQDDNTALESGAVYLY